MITLFSPFLLSKYFKLFFFLFKDLVPFFYKNRIVLLVLFSLFIIFWTFLQYKNIYNNNNNGRQHKNLNHERTLSNADDQPAPYNAALFEKYMRYFKKNNQKIEEPEVVIPDGMLEILNKLERIIHIDLKGAPPKPEYFKEFIPLIKKYGATGILIEYEDMFPYTGRLEVVKHGNAYSKDDVKMILQLAKDNNLSVMPLVQTYGHLEWLLKHKNFAHLREHPEFPQVISPCIEESYDVILGNNNYGNGLNLYS